MVLPNEGSLIVHYLQPSWFSLGVNPLGMTKCPSKIEHNSPMLKICISVLGIKAVFEAAFLNYLFVHTTTFEWLSTPCLDITSHRRGDGTTFNSLWQGNPDANYASNQTQIPRERSMTALQSIWWMDGCVLLPISTQSGRRFANKRTVRVKLSHFTKLECVHWFSTHALFGAFWTSSPDS